LEGAGKFVEIGAVVLHDFETEILGNIQVLKPGSIQALATGALLLSAFPYLSYNLCYVK
jgi:hypothetical protein